MGDSSSILAALPVSLSQQLDRKERAEDRFQIDGRHQKMRKYIGWGGEAMSRGRVLFVRSSATSLSRRQCCGGGGSDVFLIVISIYKLCQLSALSASILRLPEQTKTSATRGRGCQSRRKLMPPRLPKRVLLAGAHLIYFLSRFCFF